MIRIGAKLQEERVRRGLSLEDVEKETKIKSSFLLAIEKGDYRKLPTGAHVQGFVGKYAEYLGFSKKESLALFRREFDTDSAYSVLPKGMHEQEFNVKKRRVSRNMIWAAVVVFILLGYLLFQYKDAFLNPPISITSPTEDATISSQTTTVIGSTDPNDTVMVQNEEVPVDANGNFKKTIALFPSQTTIVISSKNRFGRQAIVNRHIKVIQGY